MVERKFVAECWHSNGCHNAYIQGEKNMLPSIDEEEIPHITYTPPPSVTARAVLQKSRSIAQTAAPTGIRSNTVSPEPNDKEIVYPDHLSVFSRFILFLQVSLISLFGFNHDYFWKFAFTLTSACFIVLTIMVKTPCFLNCFCDGEEIRANGMTIALLRLFIDFLETIHGLAAAVLLFHLGGRLRPLMARIALLYQQFDIVETNQYKLLLRGVWSLALVYANAAAQVSLMYVLNQRLLLRKYQPDKIRKYEADEGDGVYVYRYQPLIETHDSDYLFLSMFVKFFSLVHAHLPELVSSCLTSALKDAVSCSSSFKQSDESISHFVTSFHALTAYNNKIFASIMFTSLLFNSLYIIISLVIVVDLSSVYLLPSPGIIEVYKILSSLFCLILLLKQGSNLERKMKRLYEEWRVSYVFYLPASRLTLVSNAGS